LAGVKNRTALVTGCGSDGGIGFATAKLFLAAGARVAISSTSDRIFERLREMGGTKDNTFALPADLTDIEEVDRLVTGVEAALGPIDIVFNNAGMVNVGYDEPSQLVQNITDEQWRRGMDMNLSTVFHVTRRVFPSMIERNYGRIIQMSSVTGTVVSNPKGTIYSAAKGAILGMTRAHAIEGGPHNVTVNSVGPGWIQTPSSSEEENYAGTNTPVGRSGTPEEIGHVVVFLASEEASYLTGQLITIDGGNTIQEYKGPSERYY